MMKNDNAIDKDMYFLENEDFDFDNNDINYSSMQVNDDDGEFKARIFARNWAKATDSQKELKPYHVKPGNENLDNWKNYLVLLMGDNNNDSYTLKKVCFPDRVGENFGIVTEFNNKCAEKVRM